jgi:serine/threonine-protein kinase
MATVHFGALVGEAGFSRTVAIKRIRADRRSRELIAGLVDEARLVSRVQHPNVVATLDVVSDAEEIFVVLEYIAGETLARLLRACEDRDERVPVRIATTIIAGVLHGLHAAHDAKSARSKPLGIVHRDVSPQNILVGIDGLARVLDFGIAKASERLSSTYSGQLKGKLAYMAPEQLHDQVDRRTDIYATAIVLWEMLAGRRLFTGATSGDVMQKLLDMEVPPPSRLAPEVSPELDALVLRGLARDPAQRFASARHFALALEDATGIATATQIGGWVQELAGAALSQRAEQVGALERHAHDGTDPITLTSPILREPRAAPAPDEPHTRELDQTELSQEHVIADDLSTVAVTRPPPIAPPAAPEIETSVTTSLDTSSTGDALPAVPPRRRSRPATVLATAIALALLVTLVVVLRSEPGPQTAPAPATPEQTAATTPVEPTAEPPPGAEAASTTEPAAPPTAVPSAAATAAPPRPPPLRTAQPPARNCNPPYSIDARGVRRLKPECL